MHTTRTALLALTLSAVLAACGAAPAPESAATTAAVQPTALVEASSAAAATSIPASTVQATSAAAPTAVTLPNPTNTTDTSATPPPTTPFSRTLALQSPRLQGDDVRAAQQRLLDLGYTQVDATDAIFGPNTERAVRSFQQINSLTVDGIIGPRTWERLFATNASPAPTPIIAAEYGWVMGGASGTSWVDATTVAPLLSDGQTYRLVGANGVAGTMTASQPRTSDEGPCSTTQFVETQPERQPELLAVGGSANLFPRQPKLADTTSQAYQQLVADFLRTKGITQPEVRITRAIQADLDGDGTEELVLSATRLTLSNGYVTPSASANDYSTVLVQRSRNGATETVELGGNYYPAGQEFAAPQEFRVIGVFDLNADGQMEIAVDARYYEGASAGIYQLTPDGFEELLITGCGV